MLNGKLHPFREVNEGNISDYRDLQRLMFTLNQYFQSQSFQIFGRSRVSRAFVENLRNGFEDFVLQFTRSQAGGRLQGRKSSQVAR